MSCISSFVAGPTIRTNGPTTLGVAAGGIGLGLSLFLVVLSCSYFLVEKSEIEQNRFGPNPDS